jgi:hypothetical protein
MMPYRVPATCPPEAVDVDVMRFAAYTRLIRRLHMAAVFETLVLAGAPYITPLMLLPAHERSVTHVPTPMYAIAPFDSTPRLLPPVRASVTRWTSRSSSFQHTRV